MYYHVRQPNTHLLNVNNDKITLENKGAVCRRPSHQKTSKQLSARQETHHLFGSYINTYIQQPFLLQWNVMDLQQNRILNKISKLLMPQSCHLTTVSRVIVLIFLQCCHDYRALIIQAADLKLLVGPQKTSLQGCLYIHRAIQSYVQN